MTKLPLILVALLATTGCVTKNYYYGADGKPMPAPVADAATPPPPLAAEEAKPESMPKPKGHNPVYGGKAHPMVYDEPVAPVTAGDRRVPPADWDPNSGLPERPAYAPPLPHTAHEPAVGAKSDGKYVWNKNRTELKDGERYHRPTPPGAAGLNNGELIDPLSFPHFCGPGARSRGAC